MSKPFFCQNRYSNFSTLIHEQSLVLKIFHWILFNVIWKLIIFISDYFPTFINVIDIIDNSWFQFLFKSITQWIWFCKSNDSSFFNTILNSILIKLYKVWIVMINLSGQNNWSWFQTFFASFLKISIMKHSGLIHILRVPSFSFCSIFESVIPRIYIWRVVGGEKHYFYCFFLLFCYCSLMYIEILFVICSSIFIHCIFELYNDVWKENENFKRQKNIV